MALVPANLMFPVIEPADLMVRQKLSGSGYHYGTGVSGGYVAHKTPESGKHVGTLDEFCAGQPCWSVRYPRTPSEKAVVESVALSDLGSSWLPLANCEQDATLAQYGVAFSPTVNKWVGIGLDRASDLSRRDEHQELGFSLGFEEGLT